MYKIWIEDNSFIFKSHILDSLHACKVACPETQASSQVTNAKSVYIMNWGSFIMAMYFVYSLYQSTGSGASKWLTSDWYDSFYSCRIGSLHHLGDDTGTVSGPFFSFIMPNYSNMKWPGKSLPKIIVIGQIDRNILH